MKLNNPYISFVVTSRNDDHGGNLQQRMQIFIDLLISQCNRHKLESELIIVEWNPPSNREKLAQVLSWPQHNVYCDVRIIEVPPELHQKFDYSGSLPLFQMIAKNAGIRRARGEYILLTNIDIIYSNEIISFFASRCLQKNKMYRVNRYDICSDIPQNKDVEKQLVFCKNNLIRVNERWGTHPITHSKFKMFSSHVCSPESEIYYQKNCFPVEYYMNEYFHWMDNDAELVVASSKGDEQVLTLDVEPGPAVNYGKVEINIKNNKGRTVTRGIVKQREKIHILIPEIKEKFGTFTFHIKIKGKPFPTPCGDPRYLFLKVYKVCRYYRSKIDNSISEKLNRKKIFNEPQATISVSCERETETISDQIKTDNSAEQTEKASFHDIIHTNACGDFTLMHREHWFDIRGHAEFTMYSMNIDSLLCYAAHYAGAKEEILDDSMEIYHIEHEIGSGWTPKGEKILRDRMAKKGVLWLEWPVVMNWAKQMHKFKRPIIFNRENWGLSEYDLPETRIYEKGAPINLPAPSNHFRWFKYAVSSIQSLSSRRRKNELF